MRRRFIHPHRSVRSFPITRLRLFVSLAIAFAASISVGYFGSALLAAHGRLTESTLRLTGIPFSGYRNVEVFPSLWDASVPEVFVPHMQSNMALTAVLFSIAIVILVVIYRTNPLSRGLVVFLAILVCTAVAAILISPTFYFDSAEYHQIWLRGELLVWILLPWASAFLFMLAIPSLSTGLMWALLVQVYAIAWSAVRLAFCLGIFHFSGVLFLPLLWFALGILFDLVYLVLFYSWALHSAFNKIVGLRTT